MKLTRVGRGGSGREVPIFSEFSLRIGAFYVCFNYSCFTMLC